MDWLGKWEFFRLGSVKGGRRRNRIGLGSGGYLGGKLSFQVQFGWHLGWREEGPKVTRENGRLELQGHLAV